MSYSNTKIQLINSSKKEISILDFINTLAMNKKSWEDETKDHVYKFYLSHFGSIAAVSSSIIINTKSNAITINHQFNSSTDHLNSRELASYNDFIDDLVKRTKVVVST